MELILNLVYSNLHGEWSRTCILYYYFDLVHLRVKMYTYSPINLGGYLHNKFFASPGIVLIFF